MKTVLLMAWLTAVCSLDGYAAREQVQLASLPSLSPDGKTLVFEYQRDLWIASSDGGEAKRLTVHPATDFYPRFSPDGTQIAFLSGRDDTWQTYVMPASGGVPRQVTFHSDGSTPQAWFPDGKSLIVSGWGGYRGYHQKRMFKVDCDERKAPELLLNAGVDEVSLSADGKRLLFTTGGERLYRKGYEGSLARKIWMLDLATGEQTCLRDLKTSCRTPMWKPDGKGFYYVGQQDGCFNVREYDLKSGNDQAVTQFTEAAVILPTLSANGKAMVFRNLFDFYRIDPRKPKTLRKIELWIDTDTPIEKTRRRSYDSIWNNDTWGALDFTDDGLELCFTAGGDLWVMDTIWREPVAVCNGSATHEREAVFSKDRNSIYFLRDNGLGVEIWKAERKDETLHWWENKEFVLSPVTQDCTIRASLSVSPDGTRLAVTEGAGRQLWTMNLDGSDRRKLLDSAFDIYYDWAPDGKWLACHRRDSGGNNDVWIVNEAGEREPYNLSRHPDWDGNPRWSPDGKVLAYIGRRYDDQVDIYYVWLGREDEIDNKRRRTRKEAREKIATSRKEEKGDEEDGDKEDSSGEGVVVNIDFEDLSQRVHRIEFSGTPRGLFWSHDSKVLAFQSKIDGKDGTWKVYFPEPGQPDFMTKEKGSQARWVEEGSRILWAVDGVPAAYTKKYPFMLYTEVDTAEYRRLAFRIIWRELRDRFYDPSMNNLDWEEIRKKYEDQAASNGWAGFGKIAEMVMGELNASHMGYSTTASNKKEWNPEYKSSQGWEPRTAALGLEFDDSHTGEGLKISRVVRNSTSDRQEEPVLAGEILLSIDGKKVGKGVDLSEALTGHHPRDISLQLLGTNGIERTVSVEEDSYENLRELYRTEWMEYNREMVETLSEGRLGYLNIEKMDFASLRQFEKEIYDCGFGKDALVIDVRNNPGGFISDYLISILCHPRHALTIPRDGSASYQQGYLPTTAWFKPIIVLCNEYSSSNAEIFSHAIQTLKRGKIVGQPTQRAVISTSSKNVLDVGQMKIPHRGWFRLSDGLDMEMQPCTPDILVENAPGDVPAGRDPQLERAVEELLKEIGPDGGNSLPVPVYLSERPPATQKP